jgi:hypothetical protein
VITDLLARRRVSLGFICGAATLALAQPTRQSIAIGMSVAAVGEALRVWASGHLYKSREVTSSGPYRWVAHPLYAGSSIMGLGLAIACRSVVVAVVIALYLAVTLSAAIRSEETFLRGTFGDRYDRYRHGRGDTAGMARRFALSQAIANREHRAIVGLMVAMLLLVLKATYNGVFWRGGG